MLDTSGLQATALEGSLNKGAVSVHFKMKNSWLQLNSAKLLITAEQEPDGTFGMLARTVK